MSSENAKKIEFFLSVSKKKQYKYNSRILNDSFSHNINGLWRILKNSKQKLPLISKKYSGKNCISCRMPLHSFITASYTPRYIKPIAHNLNHPACLISPMKYTLALATNLMMRVRCCYIHRGLSGTPSAPYIWLLYEVYRLGILLRCSFCPKTRYACTEIYQKRRFCEF